MPYIPKKRRAEYDEEIESLALKLNSLQNNDKLSGELNYVLFRLASLLCQDEDGLHLGYARMAVVSSALSEAQAEFRRRVMAPYEDEKISSTGDVEL